MQGPVINVLYTEFIEEIYLANRTLLGVTNNIGFK